MSDSLDRKRKQYTNLLVQLEEQVQKSENDSVSQIFDNALAGIHNVNKLFEDFNPSETGCQSVFLLDTAVNEKIQELGLRGLNRISAPDFSPRVYAQSLKNYISDANGIQKWEKLTNLVVCTFRTINFAQCLLGTIPEEEISASTSKDINLDKQAKSRRTRDVGHLIKPCETNVADLMPEDETDEQITFLAIKQILESNGGTINYYRLIIDPQDFNRTLLNAFKVTLLLSNRKLGLKGNDIYLVPPRNDSSTSDIVVNKQTSVKLTPSIFRNLINELGITKALI